MPRTVGFQAENSRDERPQIRVSVFGAQQQQEKKKSNGLKKGKREITA